MKPTDVNISVDALLYKYEYRDGKVYRKVDGTKNRSDQAAGTRAGSIVQLKSGRRHRVVNYLGKLILEHRLIFALVYGAWPKYDIDHINGDPLDNRVENLRDVPRKINGQNRRKNPRNKSGFNGVVWHKGHKKWAAKITVNYEQINLGDFQDIEDAIAARKAAEIEFGFHPNHGKELVNGNRAY